MDPLKKLAERHHANFIFLQVQMMCIPEKHKQFVILRSQDSQATNPPQGIPHEFWLPFSLKTYFDNVRFSRCFFGLEVHKSKEGWGEHQKWELGISIFVWTGFLLTVQELGIKNTRAPIENVYIYIWLYMYIYIYRHIATSSTLQGTNISSPKGTFKSFESTFPQVGYVSSLEGISTNLWKKL